MPLEDSRGPFVVVWTSLQGLAAMPFAPSDSPSVLNWSVTGVAASTSSSSSSGSGGRTGRSIDDLLPPHVS
eukprot:5055081-Prorocentrum_lima.AAC.1